MCEIVLIEEAHTYFSWSRDGIKRRQLLLPNGSDSDDRTSILPTLKF